MASKIFSLVPPKVANAFGHSASQYSIKISSNHNSEDGFMRNILSRSIVFMLAIVSPIAFGSPPSITSKSTILQCTGTVTMGPETIGAGTGPDSTNPIFVKIDNNNLYQWNSKKQIWNEFKNATINPGDIEWRSASGLTSINIDRVTGDYHSDHRGHAPTDGHVYLVRSFNRTCQPSSGPEMQKTKF